MDFYYLNCGNKIVAVSVGPTHVGVDSKHV